MGFGKELRELVDKHIGPSSKFEDYVRVATILEQEKIKLDEATDKFSDDEVNDSEFPEIDADEDSGVFHR